VHPSEASEFEWDNGNESEFVRHGITPEEAEQVFDNHPEWLPNKRNRAGDWRMVGETDGGRRLMIIVRIVVPDYHLRAITGWDF
jgi:uncharacterized DUF497 family protein